MNDDLLLYYNRELAHLRRQASQFADAHPKIAGRLRLGPDGSEDPHVERLLQGFAYLTARIRHKLDDEFSEISTGFLQVLYPHYLAPIPSSAIVEFGLQDDQNELTTGHRLSRGQELETDPIHGEPCRFQTAFPTELWPIDVRGASLTISPFNAPTTAHSTQAISVLRLSLSTRSIQVKFADFTLTKLRFYIHGQSQHVYRIQELIFNHALEIAFASKPEDRGAITAMPNCMKLVGFEPEEALFDTPERSFPGYRLLTEFFTFPSKFLFFDLVIPSQALARLERNLEVFIYLNRSAAELEPHISNETFRLGCSPVVNHYSQIAEPIRLTGTESEYRIIPDVRRPLAHEVASVTRVTLSTLEGKQIDCSPFFSVRHQGKTTIKVPQWFTNRRMTDRESDPGSNVIQRGTDVDLSLVDWEFSPQGNIEGTLQVETICCNRDLPERLPFGGNQPRLQFRQGGALVGRIRCLTPPTPTYRPFLGRETIWRLVAHLTLNHLSITEGREGATALREMLTLYDFADSAETKSIIESLVSIQSRRVTSRIQGALCRGIEIEILFDEERLSPGKLFLFTAVLERFLALYASVNSFTRLVAKSMRKQDDYRRWPARVGDQGTI
jgi:type VI secretion system protein ImpG